MGRHARRTGRGRLRRPHHQPRGASHAHRLLEHRLGGRPDRPEGLPVRSAPRPACLRPRPRPAGRRRGRPEGAGAGGRPVRSAPPVLRPALAALQGQLQRPPGGPGGGQPLPVGQGRGLRRRPLHRLGLPRRGPPGRPRSRDLPLLAPPPCLGRARPGRPYGGGGRRPGLSADRRRLPAADRRLLAVRLQVQRLRLPGHLDGHRHPARHLALPPGRAAGPGPPRHVGRRGGPRRAAGHRPPV